MFSKCAKALVVPQMVWKSSRKFSKDRIKISEEVRNALNLNQPIVALESTIVTHGMPFPRNLECALDVESTVRSQGAVPASIAIIKGEITVGVEKQALVELADVTHSKPIKTSRRDLSYVVTTNRNGGTTVAGTVLICDLVGLPVFATGGIGGVHRGAEMTFDISADLPELGRNNVAVVSSGIKSILDIPKTLEYLETQGVFVATFGTSSKDFPGFYTSTSGCFVQYAIETAEIAARIINMNRRLGIRSGLLFGVPIPHEYSLETDCVERVVEQALNEARARKIEGKDVTPFLLKKIEQITAGKSLESNIALIKNNAKAASAIAVELAKLDQSDSIERNKCVGKPVVIGGSNLDCAIKLEETGLKMDGRLHRAKFSFAAGGVGRNICEALCKLGTEPFFLTAIGADKQADILQELSNTGPFTKQKTVQNGNTAQCSIVLDPKGECKFLLGDMDIHAEITPEMVRQYEHVIKTSPLLVFDGNLSEAAIDCILQLAKKYNIPVFYEPTDVAVATKPFETPNWDAITFITPNLNELKRIAHFFKIDLQQADDDIELIANVASKVAAFINTVIVTLGPSGVLIARKGNAQDSLFENNLQEVQVRHYPRKKRPVVNVSGAGDSLASAVIAAMLENLSEENCMAVGFAAAETALNTRNPIADQIFGKGHRAWNSKASYIRIM